MLSAIESGVDRSASDRPRVGQKKMRAARLSREFGSEIIFSIGSFRSPDLFSIEKFFWIGSFSIENYFLSLFRAE